MTKPPRQSSPAIDPEAFKKFEQSGWIEVGGSYDGIFGPLTVQATEPLLEAAGVRQGAMVLDVACGPGHIAAAAAQHGARAIGIDFSSSMIAAARRLHPGLEFRAGDAESLPFEDNAFDAVVIGFGLLHFARPEQAVAEAYRVLRLGGRLAFSVWDAPERAVAFGFVRQAIEEHGNLDVPLPVGPDFFRFSQPAECEALLTSTGFVAPDIRTHLLRWRVDSADAIVDAFLEGGVRVRGLLRAQTPEALAAIRAAVRTSVASYGKGGSLDLPTPCVIASAIKP